MQTELSGPAWPARIVSYYARPRSRAIGGVNTALVEWMEELSRRVGVGLVVSAEGGFTQSVTGPVEQVEIPHVGRGRMSMVPRHDALARILRADDLLLLHEGWTPSNVAAAHQADRAGVPYVVVPHGVYDPNMVAGLRAARVRRVAERRVLERALGVHVFFEREKEHVRAIAPGCRPFVAITGMSSQPTPAWSGGGGYLAWLGRFDIRPKGLDLLVEAVAAIPESARPVIRLHGPDHLGDKARVEALVAARDLGRWIRIGGALVGDDRWPFYQRADAVVFPSRWEAFGHSLVEAVRMGVPTIVSADIHIAEDLRDADAATIVPAGVSSWAQALANVDPARMARTSSNAVRWAAKALDWGPITTTWLDQVRVLRERRRAERA